MVTPYPLLDHVDVSRIKSRKPRKAERCRAMDHPVGAEQRWARTQVRVVFVHHPHACGPEAR